MYLNLIQIAESFGVSESVVEGWIRNEGLPHTPDRGRLLFDRQQVTQWAAERGLAARAGFLAPEPGGTTAALRVEPLVRAGGIWRDVAAARLLEVFADAVAKLPGTTGPVRHLLAQRLQAPGGITWAPVGGGFALPHPSTRIALGRDAGTAVIALLRDAVPLPEPPPDGEPVTRVIFFVAPSPRAHLDLLGRFSRLLGRGALRELLARAATDAEIFAHLAASDVAATPPTPEAHP